MKKHRPTLNIIRIGMKKHRPTLNIIRIGMKKHRPTFNTYSYKDKETYEEVLKAGL